MKYLALIFLLTLSFVTNADYKDSSNVKVHLISVWATNGDVLVQTNPQHSIEGLKCDSSYWLKLDKDVNKEGYNTTLSLLIAAQATQRPVTIRAHDDSGTDFCRLGRVITAP